MPTPKITVPEHVLIEAVDALEAARDYLRLEDRLHARREFSGAAPATSRLAGWCGTAAWSLNRVIDGVTEPF